MTVTIPAIEVINRRIDELPINKAELARRIGMSESGTSNEELLRRTLNGERKLGGDELVKICSILGLTIDDFMAEE